jgi:hypothetical protein
LEERGKREAAECEAADAQEFAAGQTRIGVVQGEHDFHPAGGRADSLGRQAVFILQIGAWYNEMQKNLRQKNNAFSFFCPRFFCFGLLAYLLRMRVSLGVRS